MVPALLPLDGVDQPPVPLDMKQVSIILHDLGAIELFPLHDAVPDLSKSVKHFPAFF